MGHKSPCNAHMHKTLSYGNHNYSTYALKLSWRTLQFINDTVYFICYKPTDKNEEITLIELKCFKSSDNNEAIIRTYLE